MRSTSIVSDRQDDRLVAPLLVIHVLGGFRITYNDVPIPDTAWQRPAARTLVKFLAVQPGRRAHREQVIDALWPDADLDSGLNSLAKALHQARHALEPDLKRGPQSRYIRLIDDVLALDPDSAWIDADAFELAARDALRLDDRAALEAALHLHSGDLLPEHRYDDWAEARRASLAELYLLVLLRLSDLLEEAGELDRSVDWLKVALANDPVREDVHRRLMRLYVSSGNRLGAMRQYGACRDIVRRELDVEPDAETQDLYRDIVAGRLPAVEAGAVSVSVELPPAVQRTPTVPYFGRAKVLAFLNERLESARTGAGDMILVGGEAGVGKTRLATEFARGATSDSVVLWGASYDQEGLLPYGTIVEALDGYVRRRSQEELRVLGETFPELVPLLPHLTGHGDTVPVGDRTRLFGAVARFLAQLSINRAIILVLDDLQAADTESLQLLHHLARAAQSNRWLIMGTYREEDVTSGGEFQALSVAATREGLCRRIDLRRLSREDATALMVAMLGNAEITPEFGDRMYSLSAGNPLYLQELLREMRESGGIVWDGDRGIAQSTAPIAVPRQVGELLGARLDRTPDETQRVVALAATAGMDISFPLLSEAAARAYRGRLDEGGVLDGLDGALDAHILLEQGSRYTFRHPLLRETAYGRLSTPRRTELHAAIAWAMERVCPEEIEGLAYHYTRTSHHAKAIEYSEAAGDRAAEAHASSAALTHYSRALDLAERSNMDASARGRLEEKVGNLLNLKGDAAGAIDRFTRARELGEDPSRRAALWESEGNAWEKLGEYQRALDAFEAAEAGLPSDKTAAHASLDVSRAVTLLRLGEFPRAEALGRRALERADTVGDDLVAARAHHALGGIAWRTGNYAAAEQHIQSSVRFAERMGNETGIAASLGSLGQLSMLQGRLDEAEAYQQRALGLLERRGDQYHIAMALNNLGVMRFDRGDFSGAEGYWQRCLAIREEIDDTPGIAVCAANLGEIAEFRGAYAEAHRSYERALALNEQLGDEWSIAYLRAGLGRLALHRGALRQAEDFLQLSLEARARIGDQEGTAATWMELGRVAREGGLFRVAANWGTRAYRLAREVGSPRAEAEAAIVLASVLLSTNRLRMARRLAEGASALAQQHGLARLALQAALSLAEIALAGGEVECAVRGAKEASATAARMGLRREEAIGLRIAGMSYGEVGDGPRATQALRQSEKSLREIGAEPELARTRSALTRIA